MRAHQNTPGKLQKIVHGSTKFVVFKFVAKFYGKKYFVEFSIFLILILYCYRSYCLIDKIRNNGFLRIAELGNQYCLWLK